MKNQKRNSQRRRGNREGTIFQRANGQWVVSLTVENLDGTTRRVSKNAKSQAHGQLVLSELREKHKRFATAGTKLTVADLLAKWLTTSKGGVSTIDSYKRAIDWRIVPLIGNRNCEDCTVEVVDMWVSELKSPTSLVVKPSGARSIEIAFKVLSSAFAFGMRRKLVAFNPCEKELKPTVKPAAIEPFTDSEVRKILRHVKGHRLEALHHIAFACGPRLGELLGLQWRDVDWKNCTIRIERQARDYAGTVTIKAPKTMRGMRTVTLPASVMDQLRERQKIALKEKHAQPEDFIFIGRRGLPTRRTSFAKNHWAVLLRDLGIRHRGYHHVRHTAASTLLREGTAIHIVSHILGHSDSATTHRTYSHFIASDGQIAAKKMEVVFARLTS
ncbi:tyrosine-type recombinase/integrase [Planctomicrobium sp. SH668]|uniref:tyrosine-type recombinase/integrase n=1 Tax=Planctomicrobium sp. SH668 TaxID=3448126 RepID=UPI003F5BB47D